MKSTRQINNIRSKIETKMRLLVSASEFASVAHDLIQQINDAIETLDQEGFTRLAADYTDRLSVITHKVFAGN